MSASATRAAPDGQTVLAAIGKVADGLRVLLPLLGVDLAGDKGDALIPLAESGLERRAARALKESGALPVVRVGRRDMVLRSSVLALAEKLPTQAGRPHLEVVRNEEPARTMPRDADAEMAAALGLRPAKGKAR